jgi:glutathione S-transferase
MSIYLTPDHACALLSCVAIGFEATIFGAIAGRTRGKVFTKEFMESNFGNEHFNAVHSAVSQNGYPDMGNGRYAAKLSYADWHNFNNAQRVHYNFIENITSYVIFIIIASLFFPSEASIIGWGLFVVRLIYAWGYLKEGADNNARRIGSLGSALLNLAAFVYAILSACKLLNGSNEITA